MGNSKESKTPISSSIAFGVKILIRNENITSRKHKTKTVWDNIACIVSYEPSELDWRSKIEQSPIWV